MTNLKASLPANSCTSPNSLAVLKDFNEKVLYFLIDEDELSFVKVFG